MYCTSISARESFPAKLQKMLQDDDILNNSRSEAFKERTNRRRQVLLDHIQKSQEITMNTNVIPSRIPSMISPVNYALYKGKEDDSDEELDAVTDAEPVLTREEAALKAACSVDSILNAPMLVAWLFRHHEEEPTTINGKIHGIVSSCPILLVTLHNRTELPLKAPLYR